MKIFADTSILYAAAAAEDKDHFAARKVLEEHKQAEFVTTNYVLLECATLLQRRHGFSPAKNFLAGALQRMELVWVDEDLHREAVRLWSDTQQRDLSLVDCTSFAAMRRAGIRRVFAFDLHFTQQGFEAIP